MESTDIEWCRVDLSIRNQDQLLKSMSEMENRETDSNRQFSYRKRIISVSVAKWLNSLSVGCMEHVLQEIESLRDGNE